MLLQCSLQSIFFHNLITLLVCMEHYCTLHFDCRSSSPSGLVHSTKQKDKFTYKVWPEEIQQQLVWLLETQRQLMTSSSSTAWLTYEAQCLMAKCFRAHCGPSSLCCLALGVLLFSLILHCPFGFLIICLASSHLSTLLGRPLLILMHSQWTWIIE